MATPENSRENMTLRVIITEDHIIKFNTVRHSTVDALKEDIKLQCGIEQPLQLMYLDKDFNEFFSLNDISVVQNLSSIKVIVKDIASNASSIPSAPEDIPSSSASSPSAQELNLRRNKILTDYSLPEFDVDLQLLLQEADKKSKDTGAVTSLPHGPKSRILTRLAANIYEKYSAYPSGEEIEHVAKVLVCQHPGIKSRITHAGHEGWLNSLAFKMGNYRSEMRKRHSPEVVINSGKRSKYNQTAPFAKSAFKKASKGEINWQPPMPQGLSEEKARDYQTDLNEEVQKTNPSLILISNKMALTFSIRRKDINSSMNTPDLLSRWPALSFESEVSQEFLRLVNVDLKKTFYTALDNYLPKLLHLLKQRTGPGGRRIQSEIQLLEAAKLSAGQPDIELDRTFVLRNLPTYLGEEPGHLYKCFDDAGVRDHPTALYVCVHGDPYTSKQHDVIVETAVYLKGVSTFSEALLFLFAGHYVFNCKYDSAVSTFWEFIQRGLLELRGEQKRMSSKVFNLLQKVQPD